MAVCVSALCCWFSAEWPLRRACSPTNIRTGRLPISPLRIADNLYYVGSRDLASYLIVTPAGDVLINPNLESSPALIRTIVAHLGFHFSDIHILLISRAHFDHDAGNAEIKL